MIIVISLLLLTITVAILTIINMVAVAIIATPTRSPTNDSLKYHPAPDIVCILNSSLLRRVFYGDQPIYSSIRLDRTKTLLSLIIFLMRRKMCVCDRTKVSFTV